jgi:hypothetical protein
VFAAAGHNATSWHNAAQRHNLAVAQRHNLAAISILSSTVEKRDPDRDAAAGRDVLFDRAQNAVKLSSAKKTYLTSASASQQQLEAAAAG